MTTEQKYTIHQHARILRPTLTQSEIVPLSDAVIRNNSTYTDERQADILLECPRELENGVMFAQVFTLTGFRNIYWIQSRSEATPQVVVQSR